MSIDSISQKRIQEGQMQVNLSESLDSVPGVVAQNRQNYAQDLQISSRGFGARSSFGVRGLRLYADGVPGTMPDGQGQFSHFDLGSASRIEVMRGPFSALYGNSSGGVIAIFTEDGQPGGEVGATTSFGSLGTQRYALKGGGDAGAVNFIADAAHFRTDGYRNHSAAERNNANAKARFQLGDDSKLTLIANAVDLPDAQDPLGLTRAQFQANPRQAGSNALNYNTRKSLRQEQFGATYEDTLSATDAISSTVYAGHRSTIQYQAILTTAEAAPTSPGGIIDLGRNYWGADLHWTDHRQVWDTPLQFTAGLSYDRLHEARQGFLNFIGSALGVKGALRRDETNIVYDFDQYMQAQWDPAPRWRLIAGVRNSTVRVSSNDHYIVPGNGNDSGSVGYSAVNPVAGVTFRASNKLNVYASYGKGFETPTLNDLSYRSTDASLTGLNFGLEPARSNHYEVGVKTATRLISATLAVFYVKTQEELAVKANSGGRSVFENIGTTERKGVEFSLDAGRHDGLSAHLAYTYLHAIHLEPYPTCVGLPCRATVVPADTRLPGVPANMLYTSATWRHGPLGFFAMLEVIGHAKVYTDDLNSDAAPAYWVTNLHLGLEQLPAHWRFQEFAGLDNVADRHYIGSVIVNESNSRYFEPAPGRTLFVQFVASHR